jgi:hypothetical protein
VIPFAQRLLFENAIDGTAAYKLAFHQQRAIDFSLAEVGLGKLGEYGGQRRTRARVACPAEREVGTKGALLALESVLSTGLLDARGKLG